MEFCLSSEELALGENLNRLLSRHSPLETVRKACDAKDPYDPALTRALAEMGLYGLLAPEADGGPGLGVLAASVAAEHLGRFAAPAPFLGRALARCSSLGSFFTKFYFLFPSTISWAMLAGTFS